MRLASRVFKNGGIEFVVQGLQDADQTLFVDGFVFGGQGLAAADFVQHVVNAAQSQCRVLDLLAFAVGVELFGEVAEAVLLLGRGGREWERFKASRFDVVRTAFQCASGSQHRAFANK